MNEQRLLKKREVAQLLGVSKRTVDYWMRNGRLTYLKISPRCVRFRWDEVVEKLGAFRVE